MFDWISIGHSPLEWALFASALAGLGLTKLYIYRKRLDLDARDSAGRRDRIER